MKRKRLVWILPLLVAAGVIFHFYTHRTKTEREILAEIRPKAEKGDAQSQAALGKALLFGERGMTKDEAEAAKWLRKAAEQNVAVAQYNLGVSYENGRGVAKDEVEAVKWYRKAAEQNHAAAQYNLGLLLREWPRRGKG